MLRSVVVPCGLAIALVTSRAQAAPPPPASEAAKLAQAQSWDDLYLKFSAVAPGGYAAADRAAIAKALGQGAQAMASVDGVVAADMAEKAVAFEESVEAQLLAGELARKAQQNGQAAQHYERALALDAKSSKAHLLRAELALEEGEAALALQHLSGLPKDFEPARVKAATQRAQAAQAQAQAGAAELQKLQRDLDKRASGPASAEPAPGKRKKGKGGASEVALASTAEAGSLTGVNLAGLRERAGKHFVFAYGNNSRDWGQRADYEGHVEEALEEAYEFVGKTLRANREEKVQVVLYTKEEYAFHFQGSELGRAAGFFSGKIRINGAEEMTPEVRATIVHEYTHAVVDEVTQSAQMPHWVQEGIATWVENEYHYAQGTPGADDPWKRSWQGLAKRGALPHLKDLQGSFAQMGNPRAGYLVAGEAFRQAVERYGVDHLLDFLQAARKQPYATAFKEHLGDLEELDESVQAALRDAK